MLDASAAEAVKRARLQLMLGEPYLATAVTRYRLSQTNSPNSVTTMATDGFLIVYNADFVNRCSGEDLSFILAHEVLHCVLGHIDRRGERVPGLWNVAIDLAVNGALGSMGFSVPRYALLAGWTNCTSLPSGSRVANQSSPSTPRWTPPSFATPRFASQVRRARASTVV